MPKGKTDSTGLVTLTYNPFQGEPLVSPNSKKQYLVCDECGEGQWTPLSVVAFVCDTCAHKRIEGTGEEQTGAGVRSFTGEACLFDIRQAVGVTLKDAFVSFNDGPSLGVTLEDLRRMEALLCRTIINLEAAKRK